MTVSILIIAALYGLVIGSALNAIVWRLYTGRSWSRGRSMCPDCKHVLAAPDLVPVFSWMFLRGKCRYCSKSIHWQYPAVELLTALLFVLSVSMIHPVATLGWIMLGFWITFLAMMIVLMVSDLRWLILPNKVVYPLIVLALLRLLIIGLFGQPVQTWLGPLEAALVAGGAFYVLASLKNGSMMGGGDVKLAFFMGLLLGIQKLALAMLIAFNVAAVLSVGLIVLKLRKRTDLIPFGPFLIGGTIVAYLFGGPIIRWYLVLNGLQV